MKFLGQWTVQSGSSGPGAHQRGTRGMDPARAGVLRAWFGDSVNTPTDGGYVARIYSEFEPWQLSSEREFIASQGVTRQVAVGSP